MTDLNSSIVKCTNVLWSDLAKARQLWTEARDLFAPEIEISRRSESGGVDGLGKEVRRRDGFVLALLSAREESLNKFHAFSQLAGGVVTEQ